MRRAGDVSALLYVLGKVGMAVRRVAETRSKIRHGGTHEGDRMILYATPSFLCSREAPLGKNCFRLVIYISFWRVALVLLLDRQEVNETP